MRLFDGVASVEVATAAAPCTVCERAANMSSCSLHARVPLPGCLAADLLLACCWPAVLHHHTLGWSVQGHVSVPEFDNSRPSCPNVSAALGVCNCALPEVAEVGLMLRQAYCAHDAMLRAVEARCGALLQSHLCTGVHIVHWLTGVHPPRLRMCCMARGALCTPPS